MTKLRFTVSIATPDSHKSIIAVGRAANEWPSSMTDFNFRRTSLTFVVATLAEGLFGRVIGYGVYEHRDRRLTELLSCVVHPSHRRQGVGRAIVGQIEEIAVRTCRERVLVTVDERRLDALNFLKAVGFRAFQVCRDKYIDADGIRLELTLASVVKGECMGK